jgi:hypothetical protein
MFLKEAAYPTDEAHRRCEIAVTVKPETHEFSAPNHDRVGGTGSGEEQKKVHPNEFSLQVSQAHIVRVLARHQVEFTFGMKSFIEMDSDIITSFRLGGTGTLSSDTGFHP